MNIALPPSDADDIDPMARLHFEPWKQTDVSWTPPTNEEWARLANPHLISVRLAWLTLHKSKDELVSVADKLGDEGLKELVRQLGQSADWFNGLRQILEGAECRLMCAYATRALDNVRG